MSVISRNNWFNTFTVTYTPTQLASVYDSYGLAVIDFRCVEVKYGGAVAPFCTHDYILRPPPLFSLARNLSGNRSKKHETKKHTSVCPVIEKR